MAFHRLYQLRTGVPPTGNIQVGTIEVYANSGGIMLTQTTGGVINQIGSVFTGALLSSNTIFTTGSAGTVSQQVIGNTGVWVPIVLSGINYAIPCFRFI